MKFDIAIAFVYASQRAGTNAGQRYVTPAVAPSRHTGKACPRSLLSGGRETMSASDHVSHLSGTSASNVPSPRRAGELAPPLR